MPYSQSQSCLLCCRNVCARISPKWFNLPERSNLLFQPTVWIWGNYIRCNCSSGLSPFCYVSSKKLVFPFQGCSPYTCWPGTSIYSLYKVLWNRPRDSGEMTEMWYQECTIRSNSRIISSFLLVPISQMGSAGDTLQPLLFSGECTFPILNTQKADTKLLKCPHWH